MNQARKTKISPGEMELLEILWEMGPLTARRTQEALQARGRTVSYPTVHTRLDRMLDKGLLRRERDYGGAYRPLLERENVSGKFFDLIEELCRGNIAPLMVHLSEKRRFKPEEIETMEKILADLKQTPGGDSNSPSEPPFRP